MASANDQTEKFSCAETISANIIITSSTFNNNHGIGKEGKVENTQTIIWPHASWCENGEWVREGGGFYDARVGGGAAGMHEKRNL